MENLKVLIYNFDYFTYLCFSDNILYDAKEQED